VFKILVTSKSFAKYNEELILKLEYEGILIERATTENMRPEDIANIIAPYDGLICGIDEVNGDVMKAAPKLKIIHMHGTGVDHIDIQEATLRGIYVGNCPGVNAYAVAELNLAILMAEARKIIKYSHRIKEGKWDRSLGVQLSYKTIGVIGMGYIGKRFIELLAGFNMTVLGYDTFPDKEWAEDNNVIIVKEINEIFEKSDFISLHLPLLKSTRHLIDKSTIALMKKNVILVNTARGGLINSQDLIEAIQTNRIAGAALDAFETEPLELDSQLRELDITLTPHLGASTIETAKKVSEIVAENLIDVLNRREYSGMVNYEDIISTN